MPRKRLPEDMRREHIGIRLPQWMITKIDNLGSRSDIIEKAIHMYLKKEEALGKKD